MGGLISKPKAPAVQPVQYVYVPASEGGGNNESPDPAQPTVPVASDEEIKAQARQANLLDRRRGRLGTVLTSFRGLLNDATSGQRKTLLGE